MELSELTVRSFANLLGSDAPAPGGGSASALCGALGSALAAMVSALTLGRKKYAESQAIAEEGQDKGSALKEDFLTAMEHDTEVFNQFSAAIALPKETQAEKAARQAAMQEALVACIRSPMEMMELSLRALRLVDGLVGKTNVNALSDLGVGALCLGTAVRGAWLNVLINLGGLKDEAQAARFRTEGQELLRQAEALSEAIYHRVEEAL